MATRRRSSAESSGPDVRPDQASHDAELAGTTAQLSLVPAKRSNQYPAPGPHPATTHSINVDLQPASLQTKQPISPPHASAKEPAAPVQAADAPQGHQGSAPHAATQQTQPQRRPPAHARGTAPQRRLSLNLQPTEQSVTSQPAAAARHPPATHPAASTGQSSVPQPAGSHPSSANPSSAAAASTHAPQRPPWVNHVYIKPGPTQHQEARARGRTRAMSAGPPTAAQMPAYHRQLQVALQATDSSPVNSQTGRVLQPAASPPASGQQTGTASNGGSDSRRSGGGGVTAVSDSTQQAVSAAAAGQDRHKALQALKAQRAQKTEAVSQGVSHTGPHPQGSAHKLHQLPQTSSHGAYKPQHRASAHLAGTSKTHVKPAVRSQQPAAAGKAVGTAPATPPVATHKGASVHADEMSKVATGSVSKVAGNTGQASANHGLDVEAGKVGSTGQPHHPAGNDTDSCGPAHPAAVSVSAAASAVAAGAAEPSAGAAGAPEQPQTLGEAHAGAECMDVAAMAAGEQGQQQATASLNGCGTQGTDSAAVEVSVGAWRSSLGCSGSLSVEARQDHTATSHAGLQADLASDHAVTAAMQDTAAQSTAEFAADVQAAVQHDTAPRSSAASSSGSPRAGAGSDHSVREAALVPGLSVEGSGQSWTGTDSSRASRHRGTREVLGGPTQSEGWGEAEQKVPGSWVGHGRKLLVQRRASGSEGGEDSELRKLRSQLRVAQEVQVTQADNIADLEIQLSALMAYNRTLKAQLAQQQQQQQIKVTPAGDTGTDSSTCDAAVQVDPVDGPATELGVRPSMAHDMVQGSDSVQGSQMAQGLQAQLDEARVLHEEELQRLRTSHAHVCTELEAQLAASLKASAQLQTQLNERSRQEEARMAEAVEVLEALQAQNLQLVAQVSQSQRDMSSLFARKLSRDQAVQLLKARLDTANELIEGLLKRERTQVDGVSLESRLAAVRHRNTSLEHSLRRERAERHKAAEEVAMLQEEVGIMVGLIARQPSLAHLLEHAPVQRPQRRATTDCVRPRRPTCSSDIGAQAAPSGASTEAAAISAGGRDRGRLKQRRATVGIATAAGAQSGGSFAGEFRLPRDTAQHVVQAGPFVPAETPAVTAADGELGPSGAQWSEVSTETCSAALDALGLPEADVAVTAATLKPAAASAAQPAHAPEGSSSGSTRASMAGSDTAAAQQTFSAGAGASCSASRMSLPSNRMPEIGEMEAAVQLGVVAGMVGQAAWPCDTVGLQLSEVAPQPVQSGEGHQASDAPLIDDTPCAGPLQQAGQATALLQRAESVWGQPWDASRGPDSQGSRSLASSVHLSPDRHSQQSGTASPRPTLPPRVANLQSSPAQHSSPPSHTTSCVTPSPGLAGMASQHAADDAGSRQPPSDPPEPTLSSTPAASTVPAARPQPADSVNTAATAPLPCAAHSQHGVSEEALAGSASGTVCVRSSFSVPHLGALTGSPQAAARSHNLVHHDTENAAGAKGQLCGSQQGGQITHTVSAVAGSGREGRTGPQSPVNDGVNASGAAQPESQLAQCGVPKGWRSAFAGGSGRRRQAILGAVSPASAAPAASKQQQQQQLPRSSSPAGGQGLSRVNRVGKAGRPQPVQAQQGGRQQSPATGCTNTPPGHRASVHGPTMRTSNVSTDLAMAPDQASVQSSLDVTAEQLHDALVLSPRPSSFSMPSESTYSNPLFRIPTTATTTAGHTAGHTAVSEDELQGTLWRCRAVSRHSTEDDSSSGSDSEVDSAPLARLHVTRSPLTDATSSPWAGLPGAEREGGGRQETPDSHRVHGLSPCGTPPPPALWQGLLPATGDVIRHCQAGGDRVRNEPTHGQGDGRDATSGDEEQQGALAGASVGASLQRRLLHVQDTLHRLTDMLADTRRVAMSESGSLGVTASQRESAQVPDRPHTWMGAEGPPEEWPSLLCNAGPANSKAAARTNPPARQLVQTQPTAPASPQTQTAAPTSPQTRSLTPSSPLPTVASGKLPSPMQLLPDQPQGISDTCALGDCDPCTVHGSLADMVHALIRTPREVPEQEPAPGLSRTPCAVHEQDTSGGTSQLANTDTAAITTTAPVVSNSTSQPTNVVAAATTVNTITAVSTDGPVVLQSLTARVNAHQRQPATRYPQPCTRAAGQPTLTDSSSSTQSQPCHLSDSSHSSHYASPQISARGTYAQHAALVPFQSCLASPPQATLSQSSHFMLADPSRPSATAGLTPSRATLVKSAGEVHTLTPPVAGPTVSHTLHRSDDRSHMLTHTAVHSAGGGQQSQAAAQQALLVGGSFALGSAHQGALAPPPSQLGAGRLMLSPQATQLMQHSAGRLMLSPQATHTSQLGKTEPRRSLQELSAGLPDSGWRPAGRTVQPLKLTDVLPSGLSRHRP